MNTLIHSYTHTLIHSYTHTLIHSYTHTLIHSYTHILIHSYTHTLIHSYTHTLIHSYTHTLIHSYTHTLIHSYNHTFTHSYIHTFIHSYIHTFIHSYIHTFIHSYIHTFIHSYIYSYIQIIHSFMNTLKCCAYSLSIYQNLNTHSIRVAIKHNLQYGFMEHPSAMMPTKNSVRSRGSGTTLIATAKPVLSHAHARTTRLQQNRTFGRCKYFCLQWTSAGDGKGLFSWVSAFLHVTRARKAWHSLLILQAFIVNQNKQLQGLSNKPVRPPRALTRCFQSFAFTGCSPAFLSRPAAAFRMLSHTERSGNSQVNRLDFSRTSRGLGQLYLLRPGIQGLRTSVHATGTSGLDVCSVARCRSAPLLQFRAQAITQAP